MNQGSRRRQSAQAAPQNPPAAPQGVQAAPQVTQAAQQKTKKLRKIGRVAFSKIETSFDKCYKECQNLQKMIADYDQIIKDRKIFLPQRDGSTIEAKLSPAQVIGYKRKLAEAKLDLKKVTSQLKVIGNRYSRASNNNSKAAREKIKTINSNARLARTAEKKYDEILKAAISLVEAHREHNSPKYQNLRNLALSDGRAFNTSLHQMMRRELRNEGIIKMMAVSPTVRSKAFREVRQSLGWQPRVN